jgi:predicted nucleotide-binding protein
VSYYHVWITLRSHQWPGVGKLDLTREELEARIVKPYRAQQAITVAGRRLTPEEIERIQIRMTNEPADHIRPRVAATRRALVPLDFLIFSEGQDVTDEILDPLPSPSTSLAIASGQVSAQGLTLLQEVLDYCKNKRRWPTTRELDAALNNKHHLDLVAVSADLPQGLLWPDLSQFRPGWEPDQQTVKLTVLGFATVPGTAEAVANLVAIIDEVARRAAQFEPQSPDDYLTVTSAEISESLGLSADDFAVRWAFDLIMGGMPGLWRSGSAGENGWSFTVNERGARRYQGVSTISDLLQRVDQIAQAQRGEMARASRAFPQPPSEREETANPPDESSQAAAPSLSSDDAGDPSKVFLVYGRNMKAKEAMVTFLKSIGLSIVDFEEAVAATGSASPYTGEALDAGFSLARAVLVLLTPDERTYLRPELAGSPIEPLDEYQARPNVFFEAGMAFRTQRRRTVIVELGKVRPFSDVGGVHFVPLDDSPEAREALINRLEIAGCAIQRDNETWRTAGEFMTSVQFTPSGSDMDQRAVGQDDL